MRDNEIKSITERTLDEFIRKVNNILKDGRHWRIAHTEIYVSDNQYFALLIESLTPETRQQK